MSLELWALLGAIALGLAHLGAAAMAFKQQVGHRYSLGPRDEGLAPTGLAGRLQRAHGNFRETFPYFAAAVLMVELSGAGGNWSRVGCLLYLAARLVYLPLYATGSSMRSLSWALATIGLGLVCVELLF